MADYLERIGRFEFKRDPSNGMLIGPDGCHYDTEAQAMYFGQLQLCGCGRPWAVHKLLLDCMAARNDEYPNLLDLTKIKSILTDNLEEAAEFVAHFLDSRQLTEHGGSVYGSWPTDRGKQAMEIGPVSDSDQSANQV